MERRKALIMGASGLIGSLTIRHLGDKYASTPCQTTSSFLHSTEHTKKALGWKPTGSADIYPWEGRNIALPSIIP